MADVIHFPVPPVDPDRLALTVRLACLRAERADLIGAFRRVVEGAINEIDADIAAVRRQLEDHDG